MTRTPTGAELMTMLAAVERDVEEVLARLEVVKAHWCTVGLEDYERHLAPFTTDPTGVGLASIVARLAPVMCWTEARAASELARTMRPGPQNARAA